MPKFWPTILLFSGFVSALASSQSFENTAIVRTVELGGSVVHVTTTYAIKSLTGASNVYTIAISHDEREHTSWLEAKVKGQQQSLPTQERAFDATKGYHLVDVTLPKTLPVNKTLNLVLETIQTHVTHPYPETAAQGDDQSLKYTTNLFVISPYATSVQRTKLRALTPRLLSHTTPENVEAFTNDAPVTTSGATIVYGPYNDIPSSTTHAFISEHQQPITVHYHHEQPVLEVSRLKRVVEISHWGSNLNTQDDIFLHNAGPALKGHFSRLDHQTQSYFKRPAPHVLSALTLHLPAGIRNTYYYDLIGNVSTSKLRAAASVPKNQQGSQFSILELKPRYPLLGGWNYSFTLGWDAPLEDSASYDRHDGKYIVEVPILTPIPGAVVSDAELVVILPEGASDVEFSLPFPALSTTIGTHITYLDTTGRPALTFRYKNLTIRHAQNIYVSYRVATSAHLKKPFAVAAAFFSVFILAMFARRVNVTLHQKKKAV
ncbi:oligosaccharyl transferase alpha subunit [Laccaria bicolor S238N-H82]|uniref:Dolichyl-diphosphooligosaccharide--protein glycosyltransferase subunit 1 n=1 Tax=Laccaria bicolor (strain S238N-H82 / ATCC MYA-4686) TaxID=486041 RepID=B0CY97_LACBS|nr:oligosaccharyl transferase alpha subunit [Laccaria bicolor S238N-H82]EDR12406.1 oligosaccharyl transferase alpha subunit [Laccaria bicolor S238N-H82]|eukprot:XP_001876670.1 oligosaccharyl transferase alpha subunit [Laccaria bicolor S238N-H82]